MLLLLVCFVLVWFIFLYSTHVYPRFAIYNYYYYYYMPRAVSAALGPVEKLYTRTVAYTEFGFEGGCRTLSCLSIHELDVQLATPMARDTALYDHTAADSVSSTSRKRHLGRGENFLSREHAGATYYKS